MENSGKVNVLVCGSQKFDDRSFVFGILDTFYKEFQGKIATVYTSKFAGACEFADTWVKEVNRQIPIDKQINLGDCTFDMHLAKQNLSFFDEANIPDVLIQSDPFFQSGKEKLINKQVTLVLMFPNAEGNLGASTRNIMRFASLANIKVMDCTKVYDLIKAQRAQEIPQEDEKFGLQNQHGMKR